jgi:dTDP-4-amino-4,6-dideoxygalactose transaminase
VTEVITTDFTFAATVDNCFVAAALFLVRFVANMLNISIDAMGNNSKNKNNSAVHLFGHAANGSDYMPKSITYMLSKIMQAIGANCIIF